MAALGKPIATPRAKTILALDPSLTHFGIAHLNHLGSPVEFSTVVPKKLTGLARIKFLWQHIDAIIAELQKRYDYDLIIVREDYSFTSHSSADAVLKELGGILEWEIHRLFGLPLYKVGVAQVKKYVAGKGNAQKSDMMLAVYKNFHVLPTDEHQADALGVGFTAFGLINGVSKTKAQAEVIAAAVKNDHPLTKLML